MIGDDIMALSKFKKMLVDEEYEDDEEVEETKTKVKESSNNSTNGGKMILLEPRAYSESQQIADHLNIKSLSRFYDLFRRHYGLSPAAYRKLHAAKRKF